MCFNVSLQSVVEKFVWQVLKEDSEIEDSAEVVAVARIYESVMNGIQVKRKSLMYAPAGLAGTHSLQGR